MEITIRIADSSDMIDVLDLIKELAAFENEPDAVEVTVDELQNAGFGEQPKFRCFVAEINSEIVGMALLYFRFSTWKGRTVHLEDLVVKEDYRSMGVGEALYKKVLAFALDEGVRRVNWEVLDWNERAIKFYERSGATILRDWDVVEIDANRVKKYLQKGK